MLIVCQATTQLNTQYYKSPQCIPALFEIGVSSQNQAVSSASRTPLITQIRQLAAVELRKRISNGEGKLWKKTDQGTRTQIKEALLQRLTQEPK